ncbi:MAG: hypothetical protein HY951_01990 [Bacteroidia bacterium]|nr:hypothetical protein [Bacteroidia bacterium]
MKYNLFYSWQTDLDNKTNKGFILSCLNKAIKRIETELSISIYIDQATRDEKGAIHIVQTIENKIRQADIFVGDISIINNGSKKYRKTSNPNVLYELGFASENVEWPNIICIINEAFGSFNKLPFDIGYRRGVSYYLSNENSRIQKNKKIASDKLTNDLYFALKNIEFREPKLRLKELIENLDNTEWEAYNLINGKVEDGPKRGFIKIKHINNNIFSFSFDSYQLGQRYEKGDWTARIFINQETLCTADIAFVSTVDFGFKKLILPDDRMYNHLFLLGVNYQNEGYGKQILIKQEK